MAIPDLDWRDPVELLNRTKQLRFEGPPVFGETPIDALFLMRFGLDVYDPRQLHALLSELGLTPLYLGPQTHELSNDPDVPVSDQDAYDLLMAMRQTAGELAKRFGLYLPIEARLARPKRQRVYLPPIDAESFKWSALVPEDTTRSELDTYAQEVLGLDSATAAISHEGSVLEYGDPVIEFARGALVKVLTESPGQMQTNIPPAACQVFRNHMAHGLFFAIRPEFRALALHQSNM